MGRVYINKLVGKGISEIDVANAFEWLEWEKIIQPGARVFIKPNLTWPVHRPGVTTTPQAIESVVAVLSRRTSNITVGESDGGYHLYKAEETFKGHNLYELAEKYKINVFNLSNDRTETIVSKIAGKTVSVTLPWSLLHETDVFITMPVPKTHVMTGVSLAFKNQWGCVPSPMRLLEHPEFDYKIVAINKLLKTRIAVMDGTYFLDGAGPMTGDVVDMNVIIAGDDPGAASAVTCEVMGIRGDRIRHKRVAMAENMYPKSVKEVTTNMPLDSYKVHKFKMRRALLDWVSLIGFRSHFFSKLFWNSSIADLLHKLLFAVRRIKLVGYLLYGKAGAPPDGK